MLTLSCGVTKTEYSRAWRKANRERCAAACKRWRQAHPEHRKKAAEYARKYQAAHPEKFSGPAFEQRRKRALLKSKLKQYGLSPEQFESMKAAQDNACAICSRELVKPHIDHDHETGQVRGLLCTQCNTALGLLKDSSRIAFLAASYLQSHGKA